MHSFAILTAVTAVAAAPQWGSGGFPFGGGSGSGSGSSSGSGSGSSSGGGDGNDGGEPASVAAQRAAAVKEAFQYAWDGYYKYAFPNDELLPVNNSYSNSRNGWGASAADALSTAIVMENADVVNQILAHIPNIDWAVSYQDEQVSLFETTIRYMGGLLSAYDLLSGDLGYLVEDKSLIPIILQQARHLANNLTYAFDTPTGIPSNNLYVNNRTTDGSTTNGLATIGTLVLEWTHLSDLTGDPTYAQLTQRAESYLLNPQPAAFAEPFPGLVGDTISITNGTFLTDTGGWIGGDDSFYEYLLKMYVYSPTRFTQYKDRWILAARSSIQYLASHPSSRPDLTFLSEFAGTRTIDESGHLACFDGGSFILGGLTLPESDSPNDFLTFGLALVAACEDLYNQTVTGIGPETFGWNASAVPANQTDFYERAGYYILDGYYYLRPEVLESIYYAYRATGKQMYQDWAWNAFEAITATCKVGSGFSEIENVNVQGGGGFTNFQDSFLFAEVMKYAYLIHAPNANYQVNYHGVNDYVFNTEAHPLKVAGPPI